MLSAARTIAAKDLRLMTGRGGQFMRPLLLGLLLIVLFSLAVSGGGKVSPVTAAAIFWLSSAFCQTILLTALFDLEESTRARMGLLLAPSPAQSVWLGKSVAGLLLLLLVQIVLLAASSIFCDLAWDGGALPALAGVLLADVGIVALGALLASLAGGQAARESLCSLVVFPLLVPQLLAGIRLLSALYGDAAAAASMWQWLGIAAAFDAIFIASALALFPILYGGEG